MNQQKPHLPKEDTISITVRGPKKFRQALIDRIYSTLMEEEFFLESTKPRCGYSLTSSIEPSEEAMDSV